MLAIPAIDIIEGKCVRLTQGDFKRATHYDTDPLELALQVVDAGLTHLHLVDLEGAKAGAVQNWKTLERIASRTELAIDFGGGLKSEADLRIAFDSGARQVTVGSVAAKQPERFAEWLQAFGPERIILAADAKDGRVATAGWQETSDLQLMDYLRHWMQRGVAYALCTDISKDGALQGPNLELYQQIAQAEPELFLIASGGVASVDDLAALEATGASAVVIGKALFEGRIQMSDLSPYRL